MITVDTCVEIALGRMETLVPDVKIDRNSSLAWAVAEQMTFDALMAAGSSISIRWLDPEDQDKHLSGIENLMFDLALEDETYVRFYTASIRAKAVRIADGLILTGERVVPTSL